MKARYCALVPEVYSAIEVVVVVVPIALLPQQRVVHCEQIELLPPEAGFPLEASAEFARASVEFLQAMLTHCQDSSAAVLVERGVVAAESSADAVCLSYFNYDLAMKRNFTNSSLHYSQI